MKRDQDSLSDEVIVKKIYIQSLTAYFLSNIAYMAGPFVDGIVTGNYLGVNAVAANCLVIPSLLIFTFIGGMLSTGSRNIYTALLGKGKLDEANSVFTVAFILSAVFPLLLTSIVFLFSHQIMRFLGAVGNNAHLESYGSDYLKGYALGLVFMDLGRIISVYMTIDSDASMGVYAVIVMTLVNIAGDFFSVLFTDSGMFGLGAATSLSGLAYFLVMSLHFTRKHRLLHFNFKKPEKLFSIVYNLFREGSSDAVNRFSRAAAGILINNIITLYAVSKAVAAYGVQNQIIYLFSGLYLGSSDTILVMSGIYYGEEDILSLDELQRFSMKTGILLGVVCSAVLFAFSESFAGLYIGRSDIEALAMSSEAVKCAAFALPFYVYIFGLANYMQGVKKFRETNILLALIQMVMPLCSMIAMIHIAGTRGIWLSLPVSAFMLAVISTVYILCRKGDKLRTKRLLLSERFYDDEGTEISLVADSMLEVKGMSGLSILFCQENGFNRKTSMLVSLAIEEFGTNIIKHGFSDGKQHYIYVRILAKSDEIILRIRDDCIAFNPLEYYNMTACDEKDPEKNLGIRMVMKQCHDVQYLSTFSTNNLIIHLREKARV